MADDLEEPSGSQPILQQTSEPEPSIYVWILQVVSVLILSSLVIWLCLTPKSPICIITHAYVPALDVGNSTSYHPHNTSILLNFEFLNPNKRMGIYYKDICITLYCSDAVIGSNSLPDFYQGYRMTTAYEVLVSADRQFCKGITDGTAPLKVCLESVVKYKIFRSNTKHRRLFNEAYLRIGSNGRMSGEKNIKLMHHK
ncbi:NDR1/HIN1-like protein 2 [Juglans microcarpa x Juglans regia]|uniref:NDR1/HIN1-like protein 2 n=1 Tax=Juglans microcarpa x Juglans regia TaxID=2249226 RepID=UPI001B7E8DB1|nr:NDR1/HIN1-like protein 2 [Juglans microcarpa x Juglans regia]